MIRNEPIVAAIGVEEALFPDKLSASHDDFESVQFSVAPTVTARNTLCWTFPTGYWKNPKIGCPREFLKLQWTGALNLSSCNPLEFDSDLCNLLDKSYGKTLADTNNFVLVDLPYQNIVDYSSADEARPDTFQIKFRDQVDLERMACQFRLVIDAPKKFMPKKFLETGAWPSNSAYQFNTFYRSKKMHLQCSNGSGSNTIQYEFDRVGNALLIYVKELANETWSDLDNLPFETIEFCYEPHENNGIKFVQYISASAKDCALKSKPGWFALPMQFDRDWQDFNSKMDSGNETVIDHKKCAKMLNASKCARLIVSFGTKDKQSKINFDVCYYWQYIHVKQESGYHKLTWFYTDLLHRRTQL